jgi:hypothetical protein
LTVSTWTFTSSLWSSDGNMRPNYWAPGGHDPKPWNQADHLSSVLEVCSTWEQNHLTRAAVLQFGRSLVKKHYKIVLVVVNWIPEHGLFL